MKPWAIYTRVSTAKQSDRGSSLEAQLAACTALALAHGHPTLHIADEGESAGAVNQPGIAKLRALAVAGTIAGVLVYKLDRIARNTRGLLDLVEAFTAAGVAFSSVQERIDTSGASGRLILTVLAALAEFERAQLIERVTATNTYRRTQGAWVGGSPPVGLAIERREKLRFLIPHPGHGVAVARTWPLVLEGKGLAQVATYLQGAGVPTSSAKRTGRGVWARNAVSAVLANRTYVGHLVTADDFDRVAALLGSRAQPRKRPAGAQVIAGPPRIWRLHGVARCARCGSGLVGSVSHGRGGVYPYLRCAGRIQRGRAFCASKDLPAKEWEDFVVGQVAAFLSDPQAVEGQLRQRLAAALVDAAPQRERLVALTRERDGHRERIDRALELALQGGAAARAVAPKLAEAQAEAERLTIAVAALEGTLAAVDVDAAELDLIAQDLAGTAADLPAQDWDHQQQVLRKLVIEVRIASGVDGLLRLRLPTGMAPESSQVLKGRFLVRSEGRHWLTCPDHLRTMEVAVPLRAVESYAFPRRLILRAAPPDPSGPDVG